MYNSLKKNFVYNTIYQILNILVPLILTPYLSRIMGSDGVGCYSYNYSISYFFVMFAMLGINNHASRTIARVRDDKKTLSKVFWGIFLCQFCTAIIASILYLIYTLTMSDDMLVSLILLLYVISAAIDINWFFVGTENFAVIVARNIIVKIITIILIFIFVHGNNSVYIYCFIFSIGMLISNLIVWPYIFKKICFIKVEWSDIRGNIIPILTLFIPILAISLYKYMDKIMLGLMTSKSEVGYYESCEKITQVPVILVNSLGTVMLPRVSNLVAKKENTVEQNYMEKSIVFAMLISTSMCFGIMSVSKEFVPWFYGGGFEPCIKLFQVLTPSCIFMAFANVLRTQYLIPYGMDSVFIFSVVCGAGVNLILNYILIPMYASFGAAVATLFAEATVCIIQVLYVKHRLRLSKYLKISMPFLISGIAMYLILMCLKISFSAMLVNMMIKIILGIIIYFGCLFGCFVIRKILIM